MERFRLKWEKDYRGNYDYGDKVDLQILVNYSLFGIKLKKYITVESINVTDTKLKIAKITTPQQVQQFLIKEFLKNREDDKLVRNIKRSEKIFKKKM